MMDRAIALNALRVGTILVAETASTNPSRRAWLVLIPRKDEADQQATRQGWKRSVEDRTFIVRLQEFSLEDIGRDVDFFDNRNFWEIDRQEIQGEQALHDLLESRSLTFDAFQYPWNTEYPF